MFRYAKLTLTPTRLASLGMYTTKNEWLYPLHVRAHSCYRMCATNVTRKGEFLHSVASHLDIVHPVRQMLMLAILCSKSCSYNCMSWWYYYNLCSFMFNLASLHCNGQPWQNRLNNQYNRGIKKDCRILVHMLETVTLSGTERSSLCIIMFLLYCHYCIVVSWFLNT